MITSRPEARVFQWDFIETFANNDLSKIVGIIPIAGYLILFNDALIQSVSFDELAGVSTEDSSPFVLLGVTKLRLTFFGSLLVLLANVAFGLFAPKVLSSAKSSIVFSDQVVASYSVSEITEIETDVIQEDWIHRTPLLFEDERFFSIVETRVSRAAGFQRKEDLVHRYREYIRAMAREWWVGQMHSHWLARRVSLFACVVGYALLAIPTMDIAQAVLRDLLL